MSTEVAIPTQSLESIQKVRRLEQAILTLPQSPIHTHHVLHGGVYTRSVMVPRGVTITGARIKVPTTLTISGDCVVYIGDEKHHVKGFAVLAGAAGRKQAFHMFEHTWLSMSLATAAKTVEEAENEFTDEADLLMSRSSLGTNTEVITKE